jgi:hypothetical protein
MSITITTEGAHKRVELRCKANCGAVSVQYRGATEADDQALRVAVTGADFLPFGADVVCSNRCIAYLQANAAKAPFHVDDEELKRRQATAAPVQPVYQREKAGRASERTYSCARCGVKQVVQEATAKKTLDVLGWRMVGGALFCSRDCWGWVAANMADTTPLVPTSGLSTTLAAAAVSDARHRANRPASPAGLEARGVPEPGQRGGRK